MKTLVTLLKQCRSAQRDAAQARVLQAQRALATAQSHFDAVQAQALVAQAALRDHAQGSAVQLLAMANASSGLSGQAVLDLRQALQAAAQQQAQNCVQQLLKRRAECDESQLTVQTRLKERAACEKALLRTDELSKISVQLQRDTSETQEQSADDDLAASFAHAAQPRKGATVWKLSAVQV
jgi:nitrogen fixation protein FixH